MAFYASRPGLRQVTPPAQPDLRPVVGSPRGAGGGAVRDVRAGRRRDRRRDDLAGRVLAARWRPPGRCCTCRAGTIPSALRSWLPGVALLALGARHFRQARDYQEQHAAALGVLRSQPVGAAAGTSSWRVGQAGSRELAVWSGAGRRLRRDEARGRDCWPALAGGTWPAPRRDRPVRRGDRRPGRRPGAGRAPRRGACAPRPVGGSGRTRPSETTSLASRTRRFGALGDAELLVEPEQMLLDRRLRHDQVGGDLAGRRGGDERLVGQGRAAQRGEHVQFPAGQLGAGRAPQLDLGGEVLTGDPADPAAGGPEA